VIPQYDGAGDDEELDAALRQHGHVAHDASDADGEEHGLGHKARARGPDTVQYAAPCIMLSSVYFKTYDDVYINHQ
jgi:hypothetical protein